MSIPLIMVVVFGIIQKIGGNAMIFFIIVLFIIIGSGLTVAKNNEFYTDYMSHKNTNAINAIFSLLIFLSHCLTYIKMEGVFDQPYLDIRKFLGQLVVVTYLFFSGYGIMESIKKKGTDYVKGMPVHRFFKLWYHFAIVIVMYIIVSNGIIKRGYPIKDVLLSFTGYSTVGNSNWYMFVIFAMYIIIFVSFLIFRKHNVLAVVLVTVLSIGFIILEKDVLKLSAQFYNTVCCLPAGMFFSLAKPYIDKILMKNDVIWFTSFAVAIVIFAYFSLNRTNTLVHYIAFTLTALVVLVMFMMKANINSSILDWFGQHIFSFFILQRIPMLLIRHLGYAKQGYFFIITSFFGTIVLSVLFDTVMDKLDSIIFKPRKKKEIKA